MRARPEELEEEPEAFECETCEYRQRFEGLSLHDRVAFDLYDKLRYEVVQDLHLVPMVFDVFGLGMTRERAALLLEKLEAIHLDAKAAGRQADSPQEEAEP